MTVTICWILIPFLRLSLSHNDSFLIYTDSEESGGEFDFLFERFPLGYKIMEPGKKSNGGKYVTEHPLNAETCLNSLHRQKFGAT